MSEIPELSKDDLIRHLQDELSRAMLAVNSSHQGRSLEKKYYEGMLAVKDERIRELAGERI